MLPNQARLPEIDVLRTQLLSANTALAELRCRATTCAGVQTSETTSIAMQVRSPHPFRPSTSGMQHACCRCLNNRPAMVSCGMQHLCDDLQCAAAGAEATVARGERR